MKESPYVSGLAPLQWINVKFVDKSSLQRQYFWKEKRKAYLILGVQLYFHRFITGMKVVSLQRSVDVPFRAMQTSLMWQQEIRKGTTSPIWGRTLTIPWQSRLTTGVAQGRRVLRSLPLRTKTLVSLIRCCCLCVLQGCWSQYLKKITIVFDKIYGAYNCKTWLSATRIPSGGILFLSSFFGWS